MHTLLKNMIMLVSSNLKLNLTEEKIDALLKEIWELVDEKIKAIGGYKNNVKEENTAMYIVTKFK